MSALARHLARRIRTSGPLTIADWMAEALLHPEHGYYRNRDPLGAAGDFTTAPEISQMFGELIGLWGLECWRLMGTPEPLRLVELGPGRGTLMADALRAARLRRDFVAALDLHLVETSLVLRARQETILRAAGAVPRWHEDVTTVPAGPTLLIANEFFDALPIHQFERTEEGWRERVVGLEGEEFRVGLAAPGPALALLAEPIRAAPEGSIAEVSPAALGLAGVIARRLVADGGVALIVDYGPAESAPGDSLQAVRGHRPHDPFRDPGAADLTAHVDFATLAHAARGAGAAVHGPLAQGVWLERLGLRQRTEMLLARATPAQVEDIGAAARRLLDPAEMGTLFKAMALAAPPLPAPPGF